MFALLKIFALSVFICMNLSAYEHYKDSQIEDRALPLLPIINLLAISPFTKLPMGNSELPSPPQKPQQIPPEHQQCGICHQHY